MPIEIGTTYSKNFEKSSFENAKKTIIEGMLTRKYQKPQQIQRNNAQNVLEPTLQQRYTKMQDSLAASVDQKVCTRDSEACRC